MAEDDRDRAREAEAEREAEIASEMERIGRNPEQVSEGSDSLGTQSADSGTPRDRTEEAPDDAATSQEEARELPDERGESEREESGADEDPAKAIVRVDGEE